MFDEVCDKEFIEVEPKIFNKISKRLISKNELKLKIKISFIEFHYKTNQKRKKDDKLKEDFENLKHPMSKSIVKENISGYMINEQIKKLFIDEENDISLKNLSQKNLNNKKYNFKLEKIVDFSTDSISKNSEKYKILKLTNHEIKENIAKIVFENKEYAIFFLNNSEVNDEIKENIKFYVTELKLNFNQDNLIKIFKIYIDISEKEDSKFKEYLFKFDDLGYNLIHYFSIKFLFKQEFCILFNMIPFKKEMNMKNRLFRSFQYYAE